MEFKIDIKKTAYILLLIVCCFNFVSPGVALLLGLILALTAGPVFKKFSSKTSKYLLQVSVVGLGFGMNAHVALQSGREGFVFTLSSVLLVMLLGFIVGKLLKLPSRIYYLIASGTAICGGSAIAAVAPIIKADDDEILVSIGTIFILNAIALFIFPPIGHLLGLGESQFGLWAAIAIHDTSSVVGAGAAYGATALAVATTVKLTRALWIIPLSIITSFIFKNESKKVYIPYFILFFIIAMCINTFTPLPSAVNNGILFGAKRALSVTLFLIGSGLSVSAVKQVGVRPLILGVSLWFVISVSSLVVILFCK